MMATISKEEHALNWGVRFVMSMPDVSEQPAAQASFRTRQWILALWPALLIFAAWTLALVAVLTKQTIWLNHGYLLTQSHLPWLFTLILFLAAWQVMTVAMMLPGSMPLVYMIAHASRRQRYPWAIQVAFLAGYAVIWTGFACAAFLGDTLIHWLVAHWFWLSLNSWLIGALTFTLAGGFQFSSLKKHCLHQCRSPLNFFMRHYRKGGSAAWRLGLRHGLFCVSCCWALMLVMFGLGVSSLVWMAVLTGVMVVERTYPGGGRLRPWIGFVLLGLAVLWAVHPAWPLAGIGV